MYDAQTAIGQLEARREQLEGENQELLLRKEQLQGEIQRLHSELNNEIEKSARTRDQLQQRLLQSEQDKETAVRQHRQAHDDDIERMTRERDKLRQELEAAREESIRQLTREKDDSSNRFEKEKDDLHYQLANALAERDQAFIESENEKQKVRERPTMFDRSIHRFEFTFSFFLSHNLNETRWPKNFPWLVMIFFVYKLNMKKFDVKPVYNANKIVK